MNNRKKREQDRAVKRSNVEMAASLLKHVPDGWQNTCGHVDKYSDVRREAGAVRNDER